MARRCTLLLASMLSACVGVSVDEAASGTHAVSRCPRSVDEALSTTFDANAFAGAGYVVRFIPSPHGEFRGYEVHIRRTLSGRDVRDTVLLRIGSRIPGISDGQPVLMVADRAESDRAYVPGVCVPLVPILESSVEEQ